MQLPLFAAAAFLLTAAAQQDPKGTMTAEEAIAIGKAKTTIAPRRCGQDADSGEIVVCAERDADTRYRQAEQFREKRTTFKGDVPNAPDTFGIPDHGVVVARGCFIGPCPKEPIVPYTADQLPLVDQEYLELARQAEARERRSQAEAEGAEPD